MIALFIFKGEIKKLRGEVASLKTMLLAHKECPVTMQQRAQGQLGTDSRMLHFRTVITVSILIPNFLPVLS
jgi:hypothetical protein